MKPGTDDERKLARKAKTSILVRGTQPTALPANFAERWNRYPHRGIYLAVTIRDFGECW